MATLPQGKRGRILCVDDEPHVLRALQWLLQKEFEIHTAKNVVDGLRLVKQHDFDVVVSDQRMPGVSGVEFLREVRKSAPRAMRLLLTGYSDLDAMVRSVNDSEVYRFLTKPWDIRALPKLIGEAAETARKPPPSAPQQITTIAVHPSESILLIDDSREMHAAVRQELGDSVTVQHAYNLLEAVRILKERPVSVIVSDVQVGKIDATRLVRLMKAKYPEMVSVVFSARKDAETVMTLINEGQVFRFIPKPFKPGFIKVVLSSALQRHRLLATNPGLQRRYTAEAPPKDAVTSLARDLQQTAPSG